MRNNAEKQKTFYFALPILSLVASSALTVLGLKSGVLDYTTSLLNNISFLFAIYLSCGGKLPDQCGKISDSFCKWFFDTLYAKSDVSETIPSTAADKSGETATTETDASTNTNKSGEGEKKHSKFTVSMIFSIGLVGSLLISSYLIPTHNTASQIFKNEILFFKTITSFCYLSSFYAIPLLTHLTQTEQIPSACLEFSNRAIERIVQCVQFLARKAGHGFTN